MSLISTQSASKSGCQFMLITDKHPAQLCLSLDICFYVILVLRSFSFAGSIYQMLVGSSTMPIHVIHNPNAIEHIKKCHSAIVSARYLHCLRKMRLTLDFMSPNVTKCPLSMRHLYVSTQSRFAAIF